MTSISLVVFLVHKKFKLRMIFFGKDWALSDIQIETKIILWKFSLSLSTTFVVNFSNNFLAAFALIFFWQKTTNLNCKHRKAAKNTFVQKAAFKMLVNLTPLKRWISEGKRGISYSKHNRQNSLAKKLEIIFLKF